MKILIGVCGIGNGHCIRQFELSKELIKRGHEVRILTYGAGINFFKETEIKTYSVYVPMITFKGNKVYVYDCIKRNFFNFFDGTYNNVKVYKKILSDDFEPNLCISDYEPVVARVAYKLKKPLINVDQHSKFIYMSNNINGYSNMEEKKRLQLFFPRSDKKFAVSFYKLPKDVLPSNVEILYPIIRNDIKVARKSNIEKKKQILVYFSKYIDIPISQKIEEIIEVFERFKDYKFVIFSTEYFQNGVNASENVLIFKNDRKKFVDELVKSCAVISTAGHTLISEALYCNIPLFVVPLPTYDQNYCGKFINENKIGMSSNKITYQNLSIFLSSIEKYNENIKKCENLVEEDDTLKYLISRIEEYDK